MPRKGPAPKRPVVNDPVYGARPLRRFISREVENRIGRALLAGDVLDGAAIRIGYTDGELTVSYENQD